LRLSVIVPAYNEEDTIVEAIRRVLDAPIEIDLQGTVEPIEKEVIVVDDASTDATLQRVRSIESANVIVLEHESNRGKGAAVRTALERATGDVVIIHDADLEYDPRDFQKIVEPIFSGRADVVYGTRLREGRPSGMRLSNWLANRILRGLANLLFRGQISDEATCYKALSRDLIVDLDLTCRRFEFCPEVTAKVLRRRIRIHEVPISYQPRGAGSGKKIGLRDAFQAAWTLVKYRFVK
jgi:dolichol-phosphate mannosyltransferase